MPDRTPASPLALAVLSLLEVGPLHPYGLQGLIRQWEKDAVVNVGQRANLYNFPRFPAALSFAMLLGPRDPLTLLERRSAALRERVAALERELAGYAHLPRVTLIEAEYQRAVVTAELDWVEAVVADLRSRALTWSHQELAGLASAELG